MMLGRETKFFRGLTAKTLLLFVKHVCEFHCSYINKSFNIEDVLDLLHSKDVQSQCKTSFYQRKGD